VTGREGGIVFEPQELELLEQEEHETAMRLAAARQRVAESEEPQEKDHEHLRKLEAEWQHALERLNHPAELPRADSEKSSSISQANPDGEVDARRERPHRV
jgi:hypothetical protein